MRLEVNVKLIYEEPYEYIESQIFSHGNKDWKLSYDDERIIFTKKVLKDTTIGNSSEIYDILDDMKIANT